MMGKIGNAWRNIKVRSAKSPKAVLTIANSSGKLGAAACSRGFPGAKRGHADATEAIERTLVIAVRYALQPDLLAVAIPTTPC